LKSYQLQEVFSMKRSFLLTLTLLILTSPTFAKELREPRVVTSIAPIHSLTSGVMNGAGHPKLLLRSGASPHSSSLRPSDLKAIEQADLIVWVGPLMEQFLSKALRAAHSDSTTLTLVQIDGLTLHPVREGGLWQVDTHEDHQHADHHDAATDPHIWLNPQNAIRITEAIRDQLIIIDPQRATLYRQNSENQIQQLQALDRQLQERLQPVQNIPYIVFHDAYQTFEEHYKLSPAGSVTIDPERRPGARRLHEIRNYLLKSRAVCLFSEPQFEPRYIKPLTEGTTLRIGSLDPLGSSLIPGQGLYFELIQQLADSLLYCLSPTTTTPANP
jgi:zinc transport system substrate-binding protein